MSNKSFFADLFREKLIPWLQADADRIVLATKTEKDLHLPDGICSSPASPLGEKRRVRGPKMYNQHIIVEQWHAEGQEALRVPMLWCVVEGELQLRCGGYYLHLRPGYPVVIPAGIPHPEGAKYDPPNQFCDVFIMSPRGRQMQCTLTEHRAGHVQQTQNVTVLSPVHSKDFDRMVEELIKQSENSAELAYHLLMTIWFTLERELETEKYVEILPAATALSLSEDYDPIASARQYIQSHLHLNLTLENAAQAVHLSRTQFIVLFRQQNGESFLEYVTRLRLEWAQQLLRETGWTVSYISTFIGFKSPIYFHRLFKRRCGMTPMQFRENAQKTDK